MSNIYTNIKSVDSDIIIGVMAFVIVAAIFFMPQMAFAGATDTAISNTLCKVVQQLAGPVGRGIAAVAVIFLGFSLFLGKISWGVALALAIGIAAIFGAPTIVEVLGGGTSTCTV